MWFSSKKRLIDDLQKKKPLPLGMAEFEVWSDRIIALAMVDADAQSQKFVLADLITHLNATEDFKEDGYFVKVLRKMAINQIADAKRREIRDATKARLAAEEQAAVSAPQQNGDVTPAKVGDAGDVLEKDRV